MDVVYILKAGYDNCLELRYSLRSLKNIEHGKVFIIGYKPTWLENVIHIPAEDNSLTKALNALNKIKIACNDKRISKDFILMNDDFYITRPTTIRNYNQGTIKDHIKEKTERIGVSNYVLGLIKTEEMFPGGLDYSIHCPMIYNKNNFLELCNTYDMNQGFLLRNLYGNHFGIKGQYIKDYKIRNLEEIPKKVPTFISNDDGLIVNEVFKSFLNKLFPKPSKYEKQKPKPIEVIYLYNDINPMQLKGRPNITINRFGNRYISTDEGYITAKTKEERLLFIAYGFKEEKKEPEDIKKAYLEKFGKQVPNNKKNDKEWIKNKLDNN